MLSPDYVKDMAIEAINEAMEVYDFELIQLEFVENHFHIVIRTTKDGPTISRIMQYIKARTKKNTIEPMEEQGLYGMRGLSAG